MMVLLLFLAIGFSITNTVAYLHVFHWLRYAISGVSDVEFEMLKTPGFRKRFIGRLVRCHACLGFWIGILLSFGYGGFINEYMDLTYPVTMVCDGFLLAGNNFFLWLVARRLGAEEL